MKLGAIVMDCGNAGALADFYAEFLGWDKSVQETAEDRWVIVNDPAWKNTPLVFQEVLRISISGMAGGDRTTAADDPSGFLCGLCRRNWRKKAVSPSVAVRSWLRCNFPGTGGCSSIRPVIHSA